MPTIYTIEIIQIVTSAKWYAQKGGQQFQAELVIKECNSTKLGMKIMFKIDALRFIPPCKCKVVSEIKVNAD